MKQILFAKYVKYYVLVLLVILKVVGLWHYRSNVEFDDSQTMKESWNVCS